MRQQLQPANEVSKPLLATQLANWRFNVCVSAFVCVCVRQWMCVSVCVSPGCVGGCRAYKLNADLHTNATC